jgi:hypothetical protein
VILSLLKTPLRSAGADDLEQQIAQFVLQLIEVVARYRVRYLIGFFDRVSRNGGRG